MDSRSKRTNRSRLVFRSVPSKSSKRYIKRQHIVILATFVALTWSLFIFIQTQKHASLSYLKRSTVENVLFLDTAVLDNIEATYQGAHSQIEWAGRSLDSIDPIDDLNVFQTAPLSATVDRRPIIVRKQMEDDKQGLHNKGKLLGCAVSATTFVSNLKDMYLNHYKEYTPTCDVCIQFSNRQDMDHFLPGVGFELRLTNQQSTATKCFPGKASISGRFTKWQQGDSRFKTFGYPWTVDCQLPNGIEELTCMSISSLQNQIRDRDDIQNIYFRTKFSLDGWFGIHYKGFHVSTSWPWTALMSHDDDRSRIASRLGKFWNDFSSDFVPNSFKELRLAHVEGPTYDKGEYKGSLALKSMKEDTGSIGGIHVRLVSNLFHLIRNAPGSTHIIAVVDGQANRTYQQLQILLKTEISRLYPMYGISAFSAIEQIDPHGLIPLLNIGQHSIFASSTDMTLGELLEKRRIKIQLVPYITPSISFERNVCGGQYAFAPYLAARYAADYHVIMFIDGDTAIVEESKTLQQILFRRFFSKHSTKCAGHRLRLIEQYVRPEDDSVDRVLQCAHDLKADKEKWNYAMENCHLKEGHIVARTDAIYAFSVHHPDTLPDYLPDGLEDCITPGNKETDQYFLKEDEFVQLHLRDRERKKECTCFYNGEL
jgi:hypothetical protein